MRLRVGHFFFGAAFFAAGFSPTALATGLTTFFSAAVATVLAAPVTATAAFATGPFFAAIRVPLLGWTPRRAAPAQPQHHTHGHAEERKTHGNLRNSRSRACRAAIGDQLSPLRLRCRGTGGSEWALAVETDDGVRVRLSLDDWERLGLFRGQRVPVRRGDRRDEWLFVAEVVELPPLVWVVFATKLRAAG